MPETRLPDDAPFWATVMYAAQRDGFRGVHARIGRLEDRFQKHEERHQQEPPKPEPPKPEPANGISKRLVAIGTGIGALLVGAATALANVGNPK